jgi:protein involved in polysaccharide export with SLBB domain
MAKGLFSALLFGLVALLSGCEGVTVAGVASSDQFATPTSGVEAPLLQSGDKIKITVFGEDKLSGDYQIDPGGFVSLPLAGTVKAAGLSKAELEQELAKKFRGDYLRNPKVTVDIASFRPFYIMGEVEKPGEYPYRGNLNVLSATVIAGGPTYRASKSKVYIQREGETAFKEYPLSPAVMIFPGDLVRIPERYF